MTTSASLYGKGIFTTVAVFNGEPFLWEKHWQRLLRDAERVGVDLSDHNEEATLNSLKNAIAKSVVTVGRARITFSDEQPSELWPTTKDVDTTTSLSIIIGERRVAPDYLKATISRFPVISRSPLAGVKSCNYLEQILSLDEAKSRGFHEAIRVNEHGYLTSGCMANVFWLKDGRLFTPSLTTGCLAGTTREFVIENLECGEVEEPIEVLDDAEAIFLTSAGIGVVAAGEFKGRKLEKADHSILHLLPY